MTRVVWFPVVLTLACSSVPPPAPSAVSKPASEASSAPPAATAPRQIDMDGRLRRTRGRARPPQLSVTPTTTGSRRFVLRWQQPPERLTLVYADSDDGTSLERRFATSMLRPDNADSLGQLHVVRASDAKCQVQRGRLEPVLTMNYEPKVP